MDDDVVVDVLLVAAVNVNDVDVDDVIDNEVAVDGGVAVDAADDDDVDAFVMSIFLFLLKCGKKADTLRLKI